MADTTITSACGCSSCGHETNVFGADDVSSDRRERSILAVSAALFAVGMTSDQYLSTLLPFWLVTALCYVVPYILCGFTVLAAGARSIARGDFFNEFTLMSVATLAAVGLNQLPEAVGVMLFYRIGEYVQERAAGRSRRSVKALLAARPTTAHLLQADGNTRDARPEDLAPGDHILVRPGEKIPLDGKVLTGDSQVDTSPLTGEPVPVRVLPGAAVYAGTVNLAAALHLEVTAPFAESSIARILEMVENAAARKAPTERFITRMARIYTPAVTGVAVLTALLPPLLGMGTFSEWLYRALVLLVISCPCALLISIPLGYFGGIGAASRRGILIKGGAVLDALRMVRVAAFDKTGTLTEGVFEVTAVLPAAGVSRAELLGAAALAESRSNHPIARSILRAATAESSAPEGIAAQEHTVLAMHEVPGKGVATRIQQADGTEALLLAGNAALMAEHDIPFESVNLPGSVVYLAYAGRMLGTLAVSDRIKQQSPAALAELRSLGITTLAMLTGDRESQARPVAEALKLDVLKAGLLPEDKARALEELGPTRETLFVGDGINDAPVLAAAGVSAAMGGLGSEAAVETADVVILDDNPARLGELLRLARRTRRIVWENIIMALGVKTVFMGLGIVGISGLWEAVFADVGVALLAVLNASRAGKI